MPVSGLELNRFKPTRNCLLLATSCINCLNSDDTFDLIIELFEPVDELLEEVEDFCFRLFTLVEVTDCGRAYMELEKKRSNE
jgi:hypothetical protein